MKFYFRPALTATALFALAILCGLGTWQLQRLQWKNGLIAKTEARLGAAPIPIAEALARAEAGEDLEYQPVTANGAFRHGQASKVFNAHEGKPGVLIFTPLEADGAVIYVNRGFVPQDLADTIGKDVAARPSRVEGLFRSAEIKAGFEKSFAPKDQLSDNLYFVRDPRVFAAAQGISAPPYYIDSFVIEGEGQWPKGGLTRVEFSNRHLEYALTWFGLAGALIGVFLAYSFRRD